MVNLITVRVNLTHGFSNFTPKSWVKSMQLFYLLKQGNFTSNKRGKFTLNAVMILLDLEVNLYSSQVILLLITLILSNKSGILPTYSYNYTFDERYFTCY